MFGFLDKLIGKAKTPEKPAPAPPPVRPPAPIHAPETLDFNRLQILQMMWGDGFSGPGNAHFIKDLTVMAGLDSQKTLFDLSAGLGGQARALHDLYKVYVTGFERDPELAMHGHNMSVKNNYERTASVTHYDPHAFEYKKRADAILARDLLYTLSDKDVFIVRMNAHLKERGQLIITDFACDEAARALPPVAQWLASEPYGAHPVTGKELQKLLVNHGFDVRVQEDITHDYVKMVLAGLAGLAGHLGGKKLTPGVKDIVRAEVDSWTRKLGALNAGVKYIRINTIK